MSWETAVLEASRKLDKLQWDAIQGSDLSARMIVNRVSVHCYNMSWEMLKEAENHIESTRGYYYFEVVYLDAERWKKSGFNVYFEEQPARDDFIIWLKMKIPAKKA